MLLGELALPALLDFGGWLAPPPAVVVAGGLDTWVDEGAFDEAGVEEQVADCGRPVTPAELQMSPPYLMMSGTRDQLC